VAFQTLPPPPRGRGVGFAFIHNFCVAAFAEWAKHGLGPPDVHLCTTFVLVWPQCLVVR